MYALPALLLTKALQWGRQAGLLGFFWCRNDSSNSQPSRNSSVVHLERLLLHKAMAYVKNRSISLHLSVLFSRVNTVCFWTVLDMFFRGNKAQNCSEVAVILCIFRLLLKRVFLSSTVFSLAEVGNCVWMSWLVKNINYI